MSAGMEEILNLSTSMKTKLNLESYKNKKIFCKMNTRSPKDSQFYQQKQLFSSISATEKLDKCQVKKFFFFFFFLNFFFIKFFFLKSFFFFISFFFFSSVDVVKALTSSQRTYDDCKSFMHWRVKNKPPLKIIFQEWVK